jgi:hypothetical protein
MCVETGHGDVQVARVAADICSSGGRTNVMLSEPQLAVLRSGFGFRILIVDLPLDLPLHGWPPTTREFISTIAGNT